MKLALILLGLTALTLACAREDPDQTSSRLPLTALIELMVPPRSELTEVPNLDAYEEGGGAIREPSFEIGEPEAVTNAMREAGWVLGYNRGFQNPDAQGGGAIVALTLSVDAYATPEGAQRVLGVTHHVLLNHLDHTSDIEEGTSEAFKVNGLGEGSWGFKTTIVDAGTPITATVVAFAHGSTIGTVWIDRQDSLAETQAGERLARQLLSRIKAAKDGKFDSEAPALTPADILILSKKTMAEQSTFHVDSLLRMQGLDGDVDLKLDYDVGPGGAIGTWDDADLPAVTLFVQGGAAYVQEFPSRPWECLSDLVRVNPAQFGMVRPKFDVMFERADAADQPQFWRSDDPDFYHLRSLMSANRLAAAVPELLGSGSFLRSLDSNLNQGTAVLDFVVSKTDLTVTELVYEMRLVVDGEQIVVRSESTFSGYGKAVTFPQTRDLPLCAEYKDPPCKGANLNACNAATRELTAPRIPVDACDGSAPRVCIVPFGAVSADLLAGVVARVRQLVTDAPIAVAPAMLAVSSGNGLNAQREQISDEAMSARLRSHYSALAKDLNVVLIAITPIDLYSEGNSFIFGQRQGPTEAEYRLGIISYWRMDPVSFGERPDRELLEERLTKLVLKYVLTMYSDRPESSDPTSVLYNRLFSLDALDGVELAVPPP